MYFDVDEAYNHLREKGYVFTLRKWNPRAFRFAKVQIHRRNPDGIGSYATGEVGNKVLVAGPLRTSAELKAALTPNIVDNSSFTSMGAWLSTAAKISGMTGSMPAMPWWNLFYVHLIR